MRAHLDTLGRSLIRPHRSGRRAVPDIVARATAHTYMGGTVTDSSGTSYFSTMYLCVDPASGAVTRGPAG